MQASLLLFFLKTQTFSSSLHMIVVCIKIKTVPLFAISINHIYDEKQLQKKSLTVVVDPSKNRDLRFSELSTIKCMFCLISEAK